MRAGAIRGPRHSGRERTKSGILNVSRIEQVQNASIARAGRPQHAALAAGRADCERARQELLKSSKLREQSLFKFFKPVPRDEAAAAASARQAEQRALRDEQRAKEVEAAAKEKEQVFRVLGMGWVVVWWS
jgi:hypothetical protein